MSENDSIKVFFVQKIGEDQFETESLWCERKGEYFLIDNIPFIAKNIAIGDTIKAEYDEDDGVYYFDDFVEVSGNSTVRLFFYNEDTIQDVRKELEKLGCESEAFLSRRLVSVNIPRDLNYKPIKSYLEKGEENNLWTYEESCLSHQYE